MSSARRGSPAEDASGHAAVEAFLDEVLSLPRVGRRSPYASAGRDLAAAVAWVAGVSVQAVRARLKRCAVALDESSSDGVTPHVLERLYEAVAWDSDTARKLQGSFHTPRDVVDTMVADALQALLAEAPDPAAALGRVRIVDPSVGPGAFLAGALRALRAARLKVGLSPDVPAGALCGVDISPLALEVCRLRLSLGGYAHPDLRVGDSLVDDDRFSWAGAFPGGFDIVVGNPPYLRDSKRKDHDADMLRRTYRAATSHYDAYVLFMERALQIARTGGVVSLITSNRWLSQRYGEGIRRVLLENRLEGVLDLRFHTFGDAAVETSIILVRKRPPAPGERTVLDVITSADAYGSMSLSGRARVPQASLEPSGFRFHVKPGEQALAEQMRARGTPLAELAFVTLGMVFHDPRAGGQRKAAFIRPTRRGRFRQRLLDGVHVDRWRACGEVWLDYRPDLHREPRFPELFAAEKVLCRRILGRGAIRAMVDDEGCFFSDNVVGVVPYHAIAEAQSRTAKRVCTPARVSRSREVHPHYLVALLNSRLFTWYYQTHLGFGMHLYPAHLKQMPIVVASAEEQETLAALACRARAGGPAAAAIEADIDARVDALYGL